MKKRGQDTGMRMLRLLAALALLWLAVGASYAAGTESPKAPDAAPVIVDGETLAGKSWERFFTATEVKPLSFVRVAVRYRSHSGGLSVFGVLQAI